MRLAVALAALAFAAPAGADSLSGVCPDGSMFIVQTRTDIPCSAAKLVEPHELPPIRPELRPRPHGWEVFQQRQDPNNPYNLVDRARDVRDVPPLTAPGDDRVAPPEAEPRELATATPPVASAPTPAPGLPEVPLSDEEMRDLALLVELSQRRAPAAFAVGDADDPLLVVRLAHSRAFEERLRETWRRRGRPLAGGVVLYHAEAAGPARFHPNFTFAQGHAAFHPEPDDPRQGGLLEGSPGPLGAGDAVLGYVVLPPELDPAQPLDVYWNDLRRGATLRP